MLPRILALFILAAFAGCSAPHVVRVEDCLPPPVPECRPGTFGEILIDTTFPGQNGIYHEIKLLPAHLNTEANDHAIAALTLGTSTHALVTSDRTGAESSSTRSGPPRIHVSRFGHTGFANVEEQSGVGDAFP